MWKYVCGVNCIYQSAEENWCEPLELLKLCGCKIVCEINNCNLKIKLNI